MCDGLVIFLVLGSCLRDLNNSTSPSVSNKSAHQQSATRQEVLETSTGHLSHWRLYILRTNPGSGAPVGNLESGNVQVRGGWVWGISHWFVGIRLLFRIDSVRCICVCLFVSFDFYRGSWLKFVSLLSGIQTLGIVSYLMFESFQFKAYRPEVPPLQYLYIPVSPDSELIIIMEIGMAFSILTLILIIINFSFSIGTFPWTYKKFVNFSHLLKNLSLTHFQPHPPQSLPYFFIPHFLQNSMKKRPTPSPIYLLSSFLF